MKNTSNLMASLVALLAACEQTTAIGSGCPDGICPEALARNDDACLVAVTTDYVKVVQPDGERWVGQLCISEALALDERGFVDAHMYFVLPKDTADRCTDHAFLRSVGDAVRQRYATQAEGREICEVTQLAVVIEDGGTSVAAGDGYYYDSLQTEDCREPHRLRFTDDAAPWDGVTVIASAFDRGAGDNAAAEDLVCAARRGSAAVGTACLPPRTSYHHRQVVLQTRAEECGDGVCLVNQLAGSVDPACTKDCALDEEVERRAYCSCRCDAPPGSDDACTCPGGFTCLPVLPHDEPGIGGGYCVKDGTF